MDIRTHAGIDAALCGTALTIADGHAVVELVTQAAMAADASGLVHGGFVFGLADHAAMLAVNQPTVVLAAAEVRFLAPARIGDRLRAEATVTEAAPPKHKVHCIVTQGAAPIFEGDFDCRVLKQHVLSPGKP